MRKQYWSARQSWNAGQALEVLAQSRRNAKAAKRLMRKLLKGQGRAPRVMVTDKRGSYDAAKREVMRGVEHRSHRGLNNRAENSHKPTRRRERIMKRFKSRRQLQRFVSIQDPIRQPLPHPPPRHFRQPPSRTARRRHEHVGRNRSDIIGKPSRSTSCRLTAVKFLCRTVPSACCRWFDSIQGEERRRPVSKKVHMDFV
jgi:hypothetical protein